MRAFAIASIWLCACASSAAQEGSISLAGEPLGMGGVGSLLINMRIQDARALGYAFAQGTTDGDCAEWSVLPMPSNGAVAVLTRRNIIQRISIIGDIGVRTYGGVGVGSSSAAVMAAFPNAISENAEYFVPPAREIYVWRDTENWTGLHFVINEQDQVSEIQVGGELRNIEGCTPSP